MDPDDLITLRVQYLVDSDPFNSFAMYPIPSRAPAFSFASSAPLATQLGVLLRHLQLLPEAAASQSLVGFHGYRKKAAGPLLYESEKRNRNGIMAQIRRNSFKSRLSIS
uniref:FH1/FH2 domain-containing protein 1 n=1 Tax=Culex pipiens TaxID=7175 RepID=A0A8D8IXW3_CULPI